MNLDPSLPDDLEQCRALSSRLNLLDEEIHFLKAACRYHGRGGNISARQASSRSTSPGRERAIEREAEKQHAERLSKLQATQNQYRDVMRELWPIQARLAASCNPSAKVLHLPFEILSLIFIACRNVYDGDKSCWLKLDVAMALHNTCREFRQVALATAPLWATIGRRSIDTLELYLLYSKSLPLDVTLHAGETRSAEIQSFIPHLPRLCSLRVLTHSLACLSHRLKPFRSHSAPALTCLKLAYDKGGTIERNAPYSRRDAERDFYEGGYTVEVFASMPKLSTLHLTHAYLHPACVVSNVETLQISMETGHIPYAWSNAHGLFLSFAANLTCLSINVDAFNALDMDPSNLIRFDQLHSLFIFTAKYHPSPNRRLHPLTCFHAPTLKCITLVPEDPASENDGRNPNARVTPWTIERHLRFLDPQRFPLLTDLTLIAQKPVSSGVLASPFDFPTLKGICDTAIPGLTELTVVGCDGALSLLLSLEAQGQTTLHAYLSTTGTADKTLGRAQETVECWSKLETLTIVGHRTKRHLKLLQRMVEHRSKCGSSIKKLRIFGSVEDREALTKIEENVEVLELRPRGNFLLDKSGFSHVSR